MTGIPSTGSGTAPTEATTPPRVRLWQGASRAVRASMLLQLAAVPLVLVPGAWPWVAAWFLAHHAVLALAGTVPRSRLLGSNEVRIDPRPDGEPVAALTFDDGPDPEVTPRVLDLLRQGGVRATFFLIGERATRHPDLVRRILDEGHGVENHTQRHSSWFCTYGPARLAREVDAAQRALTEAGAPTPRRFRAPAGVRSPWLEPVLRSRGLRLSSWSCRGFDTSQPDVEVVLSRLRRGLEPGSILLLHDGNCARAASGAPVVLEVLPRLLEEACRLGISLGPLPSFPGSVASPSLSTSRQDLRGRHAPS